MKILNDEKIENLELPCAEGESECEEGHQYLSRSCLVCLGKTVAQEQLRDAQRQMEMLGDALLNDVYWRGKFSTPEIGKFWEQLKKEAGVNNE